MSDGFKVVKQKWRKSRDDPDSNPEKYAADLFNKVEKLKTTLRDYDNDLYASKLIYKLKEIVRMKFKSTKFNIISYGLGSFDDTLASRYQFALLLLIIESLKEDELVENIELFDPQFTAADKTVIQHHYGFRLSLTNEKAMKPCSDNSATIFYMPHCPKPLYNNILYSNWSIDRLSRIIILGNSFSHLKCIGVDSRLYSYLNDSLALLDEVEIEQECECTNAFADLSFNLFGVDGKESNEFSNKLTPVYNLETLTMPLYSDKEEIIQ